MSLVGNLEDLGLDDILQIVSLSRKSGVLSLNNRDREGKVVFSNGQVIKAHSSVSRENLGHLLLRKNLVDLTTLKKALILQKSANPSPRLGTILAERFGVSREAIEETVKEQVEKIVFGFFGWTEGTFAFELGEPEDAAATSFSPLQFMLEQGLNPQWLAMEGSRILDEKRHRGEPLEEPPVEPEVDLEPLLAGLKDGSDSEALEEELLDQDSGDMSAGAAGDHLLVSEQGPERHLLLIDDDRLTREGLSAAFEQLGFQVTACGDGKTFLQCLRQAAADGEALIPLIDLIMPRMDGSGILGGLELLEVVRREFPGTKALILTDHPNAEAEARVRHLGFAEIVAKPKKDALRSDEGKQLLARLAKDLVARLETKPTSVAPVSETSSLHHIGRELLAELGEQPEEARSGKGPESPGLYLLKGMLQELNNPSLGGGIILLVLRFASELMNRAVIFLVKEKEIVGLGQFGILLDEESADVRIRKMRIPLHEDSLFRRVIEEQRSLRTTLSDSTWDQYLREQLGGDLAREVFLGPIFSEGNVVALIYGDNLPEKTGIGDTESFEIFLSQAGLAMEKALLERRLKSKEVI